MEIFWILLIQAIVAGGFSAFIAKEKNRNIFNWFILGFLFSLFALLALIAIPLKQSSENIVRRNVTNPSRWRCECGESNVNEDEKCYFCGKAHSA
jgi:hypothetical protein